MWQRTKSEKVQVAPKRAVDRYSLPRVMGTLDITSIIHLISLQHQYSAWMFLLYQQLISYTGRV
jgi:hypothetical protein